MKEATTIVALMKDHILEYEAGIEETQPRIRESYAAMQTNVDWARAKIKILEAKKAALDRVLAAIGE